MRCLNCKPYSSKLLWLHFWGRRYRKAGRPMLKQVIILSALIALPASGFGQTREQQDIRASAVKAALFPEYEAYVDTVYRDTPDTFEGLVKAILNWPLLGGHNPKR